MDIERLKARVYMLAGQLDEAKKILNDAVEEYNASIKKQEEEKGKTNADQPKQSVKGRSSKTEAAS